MTELLSEIGFILQRFDWLSLLDVLLVSTVFYLLFRLVRGTQAVVLLRGIVVLLIGIAIVTSLLQLRAFSWLMSVTLPALLVAVPVIFAPEIRRALERLGRAGLLFAPTPAAVIIDNLVTPICSAAQRLSDQRFGALIVIERSIRLDEYVESGVLIDAELSTELLLQIFHINTPLHDGAVIVRDGRIAAAAVVLPLSASGTTSRTAVRQMGLRHRASLGISEVSDALAVVVSEETGAISLTHNARMIRKLDQPRLRNILTAFYRPQVNDNLPSWMERLSFRLRRRSTEIPGD